MEGDNSSGSQRVRSLPRLAHKKSKTGCLRCKQRRIKCDEVHPICGACQRHCVSCDWPTSTLLLRPSERLQSPEAESSCPKSEIVPVQGIRQPEDEFELTESSSRRHLELRLMHHFCSYTCRTLPGADVDEVWQTWSRDVPPLAMEPGSENVLYSIYALAALHIADSCEQSRLYREAFHRYFSLALQAHNEAVSNLNASNVESVALTYMLISILTFYPRRQGQKAPCLPQRVIIANGGGVTFRETWSRVRQVPQSSAWQIVRPSPQFLEALLGSIEKDPIDGRMIYPAEAIPEPLKHILDQKLPEREDWETERWDETTVRAYGEALSYIGAIYRALQAQENQWMVCRRFMGFCPMLSSRFIELVRAHEPRALVVMAHYYALTKGMKNIWWIKDLAYREVMEILSMLPERWKSMIQWPLELTGLWEMGWMAGESLFLPSTQ